MHHFKSAQIAIAHSMQCYKDEIQSWADAAMNYALGKVGANEGWGCKEAGDIPAWGAAYCASCLQCDLCIQIEDNNLTKGQAESDWREIYMAMTDYFGIDAMVGIQALDLSDY